MRKTRGCALPANSRRVPLAREREGDSLLSASSSLVLLTCPTGTGRGLAPWISDSLNISKGTLECAAVTGTHAWQYFNLMQDDYRDSPGTQVWADARLSQLLAWMSGGWWW